MTVRPLAPQDRHAIMESVVFNAVTRVLSQDRVHVSLSTRTRVTREVLKDLTEAQKRLRG